MFSEGSSLPHALLLSVLMGFGVVINELLAQEFTPHSLWLLWDSLAGL